MDIEYIYRPRVTIAVITVQDGSQRVGSYTHDGKAAESFASAMALQNAVDDHVSKTLLQDMTDADVY